METSLHVPTPSRTESLLLKVLTGLLFVWMLAIGVFKLIGTEPALLDTFGKMNLLWALPLVGMAEIAGGIGLLLKKTRVYAAIALIFLIFGGFAGHVVSQTFLPMGPMGAVAILMLACVLKFDGRLKISA